MGFVESERGVSGEYFHLEHDGVDVRVLFSKLNSGMYFVELVFFRFLDGFGVFDLSRDVLEHLSEEISVVVSESDYVRSVAASSSGLSLSVGIYPVAGFQKLGVSVVLAVVLPSSFRRSPRECARFIERLINDGLRYYTDVVVPFVVRGLSLLRV